MATTNPTTSTTTSSTTSTTTSTTTTTIPTTRTAISNVTGVINTTTKNMSLTTGPILPSNNEPQIYELGFLIGMVLMATVVVMIVLFMSITACQRSWKARKKKTALLPVTNNNLNDIKK